MIELVVFDIAGTTVHDGDAVNSSLRAALGAAGIEVDRAAGNTVMGLPKPEAIRRLLHSAGQSVSEREVTTIHADFVRRMCDFYATDPSIREVPGAAATFAALRQAGIMVALNTGFNREIVEVLLARLGWRSPEVIDAWVTSDQVPRGRPYPDMIQFLMKLLGIPDACKVAKVGDTAVDLEEGYNAGCEIVIGATSGSFSRAQLERYPHSHLVASVAEVPGILLSCG
jgi:phosphonatase-like hydrolase